MAVSDAARGGLASNVTKTALGPYQTFARIGAKVRFQPEADMTCAAAAPEAF